MKKVIAILLSTAMVFSLAACAKQEAPAETVPETTVVETVAETTAATEAATEAEAEISLVDIFSDALFGYDEKDFTATEFQPSKEGTTTIESYARKDGLMSIVTYAYDNTDGLSLKEYMLKVKKAYPGCVDIKEFDGTEFAVHSTLVGDGDDGVLFTNFTTISGDKFITKSYIYPCFAYQLGDTDTYVTIPKIMEQKADAFESEAFGEGFLGGFFGADEGLADMYLYVEDANSLSYEGEKASWEYMGYEMVDEDRFNAWVKDGITLEEVAEYYKAVLGDDMTDCLVSEAAGLPAYIFEYRYEYEGKEYTAVSITWVDGSKIAEIYLEGLTERWPCMGEAISYGVFKKFEPTTDLAIVLNPDRYEQTEYTAGDSNAEVLAYYADKQERMDVYDKRVPVGDYGSVEGYIAAKSANYRACTSMLDYYGNDMGLYTYFTDSDGEPLFKKKYVTLHGDSFFVRSHIYHTYEAQFGNSDWYLYIPKVIKKSTSEELKKQYEATDVFEPEDKFMPMIVFAEYGAEDLTYEKEKASWESTGVAMVSEAEFKTLFANGITTEAVDKYFGELLGDMVIEHLYDTINGIEFTIYQTEFESNGVKMSSAFMNWVEDGKLREIYLLSEADTWANMGLALINSMHKK